MAIAVNQAHVSRALDFYNKEGKYFSIGRTSPWENETNPPTPSLNAYKIDEIVALKKVDNCYLVVKDDDNGTISYRDNKWRIVQPSISTTVATAGVSKNSTSVLLKSMAGIVVGNRLRINEVYEGKILSIDTATNSVTLDTPAPEDIPGNSPVLGGAYVENANYVYIECSLNYDQFPIVTYRQVGVQTGVLPNNQDILRSSKYSSTLVNEYTNIGLLEIVDNRPPITRQADQAEKLSLIIQF